MYLWSVYLIVDHHLQYTKHISVRGHRNGFSQSASTAATPSAPSSSSVVAAAEGGGRGADGAVAGRGAAPPRALSTAVSPRRPAGHTASAAF